MDVTYRLQGVTFEWDEDKARANVEKHGVTFEEAAEAFFDPFLSRVMPQSRVKTEIFSWDIRWRSACCW